MRCQLLGEARLGGLMASYAFDELGRMRTPTLLLWGDRDALFPGGDQRTIVGTVHGAQLRVYPETGHCPNWEPPEWVAADIGAFIAGTARG
mgnify:CR=1 FL=1